LTIALVSDLGKLLWIETRDVLKEHDKIKIATFKTLHMIQHPTETVSSKKVNQKIECIIKIPTNLKQEREDVE